MTIVQKLVERLVVQFWRRHDVDRTRAYIFTGCMNTGLSLENRHRTVTGNGSRGRHYRLRTQSASRTICVEPGFPQPPTRERKKTKLNNKSFDQFLFASFSVSHFLFAQQLQTQSRSMYSKLARHVQPVFNEGNLVQGSHHVCLSVCLLCTSRMFSAESRNRLPIHTCTLFGLV